MKHLKIGFIGTGSMGQAFIRAYLSSGQLSPQQIYASNRSEGKLKKIVDQWGINAARTNEELADICDVVFLGVKPQDLPQMLEPLSRVFSANSIVISMAAGLSLATLRKLLPQVSRLVRIMPNTPVEIRQAVIGYCIAHGAEAIEPTLRDLLDPLGLAVAVPEGEGFEALTVSCGSGTGFVFELMIYWQEWLEEHGFDADVAREMTVKTFLGAAQLAENSREVELEELQRRVVSKRGVTHAGLESMRELEVDRGLRYSFEKAVLRDRELGRNNS